MSLFKKKMKHENEGIKQLKQILDNLTPKEREEYGDTVQKIYDDLVKGQKQMDEGYDEMMRVCADFDSKIKHQAAIFKYVTNHPNAAICSNFGPLAKRDKFFERNYFSPEHEGDMWGLQIGLSTTYEYYSYWAVYSNDDTAPVHKMDTKAKLHVLDLAFTYTALLYSVAVFAFDYKYLTYKGVELPAIPDVNIDTLFFEAVMCPAIYLNGTAGFNRLKPDIEKVLSPIGYKLDCPTNLPLVKDIEDALGTVSISFSTKGYYKTEPKDEWEALQMSLGRLFVKFSGDDGRPSVSGLLDNFSDFEGYCKKAKIDLTPDPEFVEHVKKVMPLDALKDIDLKPVDEEFYNITLD